MGIAQLYVHISKNTSCLEGNPEVAASFCWHVFLQQEQQVTVVELMKKWATNMKSTICSKKLSADSKYCRQSCDEN